MLTIDTIISKYTIHSYDDKSIQLNEHGLDSNNQQISHSHRLTSSCYVSFENLIINFSFDKFCNLHIACLQNFNNIDILLIGTGKTHQFPEAELYLQLKTLSYSTDFMDTAAACRTFNLLVNEHRKVGALLLL